MSTTAHSRWSSPRRRTRLGVLAAITALVVQLHVALLQSALPLHATAPQSQSYPHPPVAVSLRSQEPPPSADVPAPRPAPAPPKRTSSNERVQRAPVALNRVNTAAQTFPADAPAHAIEAAKPTMVAAETEPAALPMPTYPTQIPPSFVRSYELRRAGNVGSAELTWHIQGQGQGQGEQADSYEARLTASLARAPLLEWTSQGGFDAAGLAPLRYTDRRRGRGAQAANFRRAIEGGGSKISYSGPAVEHPLPAGAQDRLSWIVQLAAIARGLAAAPEAMAPISVFVTGARGDADVWTFEPAGIEAVETPAGVLNTLKLVREPRRLYDTHVENLARPRRGLSAGALETIELAGRGSARTAVAPTR